MVFYRKPYPCSYCGQDMHSCEETIRHSCEGKVWMSTHDPPWQRGPNPYYPQFQVYSPIPGVEHKSVMKNIKTGEIISHEEWEERYA